MDDHTPRKGVSLYRIPACGENPSFWSKFPDNTTARDALRKIIYQNPDAASIYEYLLADGCWDMTDEDVYFLHYVATRGFLL